MGKPSVLFLDEPTTGLDSLSAYSVVDYLNLMSKSGSTVIATIHQPSFKILNLFDDLVILHFGRVFYSGPIYEDSSYNSNVLNMDDSYSSNSSNSNSSSINYGNKGLVHYLKTIGFNYNEKEWGNISDYLFMEVLPFCHFDENLGKFTVISHSNNLRLASSCKNKKTTEEQKEMDLKNSNLEIIIDDCKIIDNLNSFNIIADTNNSTTNNNNSINRTNIKESAIKESAIKEEVEIELESENTKELEIKKEFESHKLKLENETGIEELNKKIDIFENNNTDGNNTDGNNTDGGKDLKDITSENKKNEYLQDLDKLEKSSNINSDVNISNTNNTNNTNTNNTNTNTNNKNKNVSTIHFEREQISTSDFSQIKSLVKIQTKILKRRPILFVSRFLQSIITAILIGPVFWNVQAKKPITMIFNKNCSGFLYQMTLNNFYSLAFSSVPIFHEDERLLKREIDNRMYLLKNFYVSKLCIQYLLTLPLPILTPLIMLGFSQLKLDLDQFLIFLLANILNGLVAFSFACFVSCLIGSDVVATVFVSLVLLPLATVTGMMVDPTSLPKGYSLIQYLSPTKYIYNIQIKNFFKNTEVKKEDVLYNLYNGFVSVGVSFVILILFVVFFLVGGYFAFKRRIINSL